MASNADIAEKDHLWMGTNSSLEVISLEPVLQESRTLARHYTDDDHALQSIQPAEPAGDQYQLYEFSLDGRE